MTQIDTKKLVIKLTQAVSLTLGSAFIAYNITAFKVEKHGSYYFLDPNQTWLAIGVGLIFLGWIVKNWNKL